MRDGADVRYTKRERIALVLIAAVGFLLVNGTFVYAVASEPDLLSSAMANPVAAAFVVEALLLAGLLAYLLHRWRVSRVHWAWFVVLSLVGSIAFALPVVLLLSDRRTTPRTPPVG